MSEAAEPYRPLGLLAFLDPELKAAHDALMDVEERRRDYAIARLAQFWGCPFSQARELLDYDDRIAMEWFHVGNNNPRDVLH